MLGAKARKKGACRRPWSIDFQSVSRLATAPATTTTAGASTVATTTAATVASTTAATATGAVGLGARFIDVQIAAAEVGAVEGFDRLVSGIVVHHLDEREAARLSGVAVGDNVHLVHCAVGLKQRPDLVFRRVKG